MEEKIDIPGSWAEVDIHGLNGLILVLGETDTGKSTLANHLYRQICQAGRPAAFLDGDPGQSLLGPPTTMTLVTNVSASRRSFVGSTSPRGHMLPLLLGAERLVRFGQDTGVQVLIYDTCGMVDPAQGGFSLKLSLIELLRPVMVLCIQRLAELEPLLLPLERSGKTEVVRLRPSPKAERRSRVERQYHRMKQYASYFSGARNLKLDWRSLAVFPAPKFSLNRLLAFEDSQGFALGLGILSSINRQERSVGIFTPLPSFGDVRALRLGSMAVDPATFRETWNGPDRNALPGSQAPGRA